MAAVTKNLIFGVTASLTYEKPYALARRLCTVYHLSEGRVAWNIVTSYLDSAARNQILRILERSKILSSFYSLNCDDEVASGQR